MMIDEMMEAYKTKYEGEYKKDLTRDVSTPLAIEKFLADECVEYITYELSSLKEMLKGYFDTGRMEMKDKSEKFALEANSLAHNLVHEALTLWTLTEGMLPQD